MMPLTVVVLDTGGHVIAMKREDGSGIMRNEIAIGKACVYIAISTIHSHQLARY